MGRFISYADIFDGMVPENFGVSKIEGTSMTIPGQGSDLAQIIASIVKLPPLDERTFDVSSVEEPDLRSLAVKTDLDGLYGPEGSNLAEDALKRQKARKEAIEAQEAEKAERSENAENE